MTSDLLYLKNQFYQDVHIDKDITHFNYTVLKPTLESHYQKCLKSSTQVELVKSMCDLAYTYFLLGAKHNRYQHNLLHSSSSTLYDSLKLVKGKLHIFYLSFVYNRKFQKMSNVFYSFLAGNTKINQQKYNTFLYRCFFNYLSAKKEENKNITLVIQNTIEDFINLYKYEYKKGHKC